MGATEAFLRDLGRRGVEPSLRRATGTVRVTVDDTSQAESWLVTIDRGRVSVSRGRAPAECEIRASRALLDAIVNGTKNMLAAHLRGELAVAGNRELVVLFQRLLPPPVGHGQRPEGPTDD
jgi:hypothetical protein